MSRQSTRAKGNAWENRIREYLQSLGWTVDKARATLFIPRGPGGRPKFKNGKLVVFSTANDFFGCIDLMAVHPAKPYTLFIQATAWDVAANRKLNEILAVPWNLAAQRVQFWQKKANIISGARVLNLGPVQDPAPGVAERGQEQGPPATRMGWRESFFRLKNGQPAPLEVLP